MLCLSQAEIVPLTGEYTFSSEGMMLKELSHETFLLLSPSESFSAINVTATMLHNFFRQPRTRIVTNLQSMAFALGEGKGITLGNLRFLAEEETKQFVEVPLAKLKNAGYDETIAYDTGVMSEKKELFLAYAETLFLGQFEG